MSRRLSILLVLLLLASAPALAWTARVIGVTDGDTIKVLHVRGEEKTERRIRLYGIDCPEDGQPFSSQAKKATSALAFGKTVDLQTKDVDRYGRIVAIVVLPDKKNLNEDLVSLGMAWWYRKYAPKDKTLERLEAEARKARRGLWSDPNPIPPWEWREEHRNRRASRIWVLPKSRLKEESNEGQTLANRFYAQHSSGFCNRWSGCPKPSGSSALKRSEDRTH